MLILKTILLQPSTSTLNKGKIEANFYTLLQHIPLKVTVDQGLAFY